MPIEFEVEPIEQKLKTFTTKAQKLKYLSNYLFDLKRKKAEFTAFNEKNLTRLIKKTEKDFEKYQNELDKGKHIYLSNDKFNKKIAESIGIENVELLKKRVELEYELPILNGKIEIFEGLIERVEKEPLPPENTETSADEKTKFYTDADFHLLIDNLLTLELFQVSDFLESHYSKAFRFNTQSQINWLTALGKNLIQRFKSSEKITKGSVSPSGVIPIQVTLANTWLQNKSKQTIIEFNQRVNKNPEQSKTVPLKLSDIFESISNYQAILNLLVEKQHCQPNTFIWMDSAKGNKSLLAAIIKHLHTQKYYKDHKMPTLAQIKEIAQNTFGWEISIDTIKRARPEQFDLKFIPPASTLP
jgi:hypothetical protein